MSIKTIFSLNLVFIFLSAGAQHFSGVYKLSDLSRRLNSEDTLYVVNFWATWCKPCVKELPSFDSLQSQQTNSNVKVLLVALDFKEDIENKLIPFLMKHKVTSECVLLDELNGETYISRISKDWTGAIPATLLKKGNQEHFIEKKLTLQELQTHIKILNTN